MNKDQAVVLATGVCKFAAGALTAHGLTADASLVNSQDTIGLIAYLILAGISHWYNKSDTPAQIPPNTSGISKTIGCATLVFLSFISSAQTNPPASVVVGGVTYYAQPSTASTIPTTNGFLQTLKYLGNDISTASNYSANAYGSYKPKANGNDAKVGGGILLVYNVAQHVGVAAGLDYFGGWTLVSGNVTFKLPFTPLAGWGITNLVVIPNAIAGIGTSFGGSGTSTASVETIAGTGASVEFGHAWGGQFDAGLEAVNLSNAGIYSGWDYRLFVGWGKGF